MRMGAIISENRWCEYGDASPTQRGKTRASASQVKFKQVVGLKPLLSKIITNNQLLILSEIGNRSETITSILLGLSAARSIPLSTLKSSAKSLRELNIIKFGNSGVAELTSTGKLIARIFSIDIRGEKNE